MSSLALTTQQRAEYRALGYWVPNPGPQEFAISQAFADVFEIFFGGSRGPGKTAGGLGWLVTDLNHPNLRALVIRKNADDLSDWVDRAESMYKPLQVNAAYRPAILRFGSGALVRTGHLKDDSAYTKYQGHEYQRMLLEELTQIPTEKRYLQLIASCRSVVPGLKPQVFATANPGGVGHGWVKKRFVTPDPEHNIIDKHRLEYLDDNDELQSFEYTLITDKKTGLKRVYIPATISDNPVLVKNDPNYVNQLEALQAVDPDLWKAWRLGDWDVWAGQAFREWRHSKHVVSAFDFPLDQCQRIISFDWGYRDKGVATWLAFTPENRWGVRRCYMYRQVVHTETDPDTWAEEMATYCSVDKVKYMVMPPDTFAHKESKVTIASTFEAALKPHRVPIVRADASSGSRLNRKAITHKFLADAPDGKPYLQVHESCTDWIESIPTLVYDERNVEDIAEGDDHSWDSGTYGIVAYVKTNPGIIIKQTNQPSTPKSWVVNGGVIKPEEDIMEKIKHNMNRGDRTWQS